MKYLLFSLSLLIAVPVSAQSLTPPKQPLLTVATIAFFTSAQTDAAMTYRCQTAHTCIEGSPLYANMSPATSVVSSIAIDTAAAIVLSKVVGKHHPKIAAVILFTLASTRIDGAIRGWNMPH